MTLKQTGFTTNGKPRYTPRTAAIGIEIEETRRRFDNGDDVITLDEAWRLAKSVQPIRQRAQAVLPEQEKVIA